MIETGYKPEFGLGALYQGFNAANADRSAQEEIIKQFLANQREQQMQPLDVNIKQTESDRATVGRQPNMLDAYERGYIGQNNSQDAAGQKAMALAPFQIAAETAKARQEQSQANLFGKMFGGVEKQYDKSLPENDRVSGATEAFALANTLKQIDPKFQQQQQLREMGEDSREYIAELGITKAELAARLRAAGGGGDKPPKTFEEVIARILVKKQSGVQLSEAEEAVLQEAAGGFNAKNAAKVQEGTTLDSSKLGPDVPLKPKTPQQQYTPNTTTPQTNLKQQVEASGVAYEPDKYEYRVVDGKVQRKLKGN